MSCPHGYADVPQAVFRPTSPGPVKDTAKVRVIHDRRECPECLLEQIKAANEILNHIYERGSSYCDRDVLDLWSKYVTRYNP